MPTPAPELNSAIWSRLPHILLPIIIENTADVPTLEAWCQSTKHSSYLHRIAQREAYRTYIIDTNRFRRTAPSDSREDQNKVTEPSYRAHPPVAVSPLEFHQEIARHVQRLVLDLEYQGPGAAFALTEDLDFIWQSFLSHATCLEEIEHNGILRQAMLDRLLGTPSLKVLKIREILTKYVKRWDDILLTWQKLEQCSSLRVLDVSQLFHAEALGLAIAIRNLHNLEELRVKASELPLPGLNRLGSDDPSPLKPFLRCLYHKTGSNFERLPVGFPARLKKLALVDVNSRLMPISIQDLDVASLKHLTHLHLDLLMDVAAIHLIDVLNPSKLTHLIISSILYVESESRSAWLRIHEVLARHSPTLRQITLFNAWLNFQSCSPDVDPPWQSFMEFSQLYLAKHPKSSFFIHDNNLHWLIFGNINRASKWGLGVRQIRIDQVDLNGLKVNRIDEPSDGLQHLRILTLRTLQEQLEIHKGHGGLGYLPCSHEPLGPSLPNDMDTLKEAEIAKAIAAQELPSLRIISVGRFRFWVQHQSARKSDVDCPKVVWFLHRALEDAEQEAEIMRVVHPDDWKFLADQSDCLAETASDESVRLANRLVYRKIQAEEVT